MMMIMAREHVQLWTLAGFVSWATYLWPVHKWRLMAGYRVAPNTASAAACRQYRPGTRSPETTIIIRSPQKLWH